MRPTKPNEWLAPRLLGHKVVRPRCQRSKLRLGRVTPAVRQEGVHAAKQRFLCPAAQPRVLVGREVFEGKLLEGKRVEKALGA